MLYLSFPDISHKSRYLDMIEEWKNFEQIPTSPSNLFMGDTYEDLLMMVTSKLFFGKGSVPSSLYLFMNNDVILGAIDIRHHIDHPQLSIDGGASGHIGYGLRPSERGKGLAKKMLALGLIEAHRIGLDSVIISADDDNSASWRTIESCGGQLLKTITKDDKLLRVYSIKL